MEHSEFMRFLDNQLGELVSTFPVLRTKERAFIAWTLLHLPDLDISEKEAIDSIVDGDQEKGIDAIYIPEKDGKIVVLQTVYHKDPRSKGIKKNELVKLFKGVDWLFKGNLSRIDNVNFKTKAEEFREAYINFDYSSLAIVFAATVTHSAGKEVNDEIELYGESLSERGAPYSIETLGIKELIPLLISRIHQRNKIDFDLNLTGKPYEYDPKLINARAYVGSVKGKALAELFAKYKFRIFDANIRNSLGNVKINQGIKGTAIDPQDSNLFWFYNNGITIVCEEIGFRSLEDTKIKLTNAQIINGCQTVTSLFDVGNKLSDNVEVLVKIIEKKSDIDFVRRVTTYANSQNAVRLSDYAGTDTIQLELKSQLLNLGFYYETRRGDYKAEKESLKSPVMLDFNLKEAAQAVAATYLQIPGIAKKDTSKLFLASQDGGYYDKIFNLNLKPEQILVSIYLMNTIHDIRVKSEEDSENMPSWLPHSDYFITSLFFRSTYNRKLANNKEYNEKYRDWVNAQGDGFEKVYDSIIKILVKIINKQEKKYGYSHPQFFKTQHYFDEYLVSTKIKAIKEFPK